MLSITDKKARSELDELRERVNYLEKKLRYYKRGYVYYTLEQHHTLDANDVMDRFHELYNYLSQFQNER